MQLLQRLRRHPYLAALFVLFFLYLVLWFSPLLRWLRGDVASIELVEVAPGQGGGDIVFVHGLGGGADGTWTHTDTHFDFVKALSLEMPTHRVLKVNYDAPMTAWGGDAIDVIQRARTLIPKLTERKVGNNTVVFVCHSLGGIVVKQMLRDLSNNKSMHGTESACILENTTGIAFLSTPHSGSSVASLAKLINSVTHSSSLTGTLTTNNKDLLEIQIGFYELARGQNLAIKSWYELKPHAIAGTIIVDQTSAMLQGYEAEAVEKDHIQICKPRTSTDGPFPSVTRFVQKNAAIGTVRCSLLVGELLKKVNDAAAGTKVQVSSEYNNSYLEFDGVVSIDSRDSNIFVIKPNGFVDQRGIQISILPAYLEKITAKCPTSAVGRAVSIRGVIDSGNSDYYLALKRCKVILQE